ncbi:hypothetical protein [Nostoc sp.]
MAAQLGEAGNHGGNSESDLRIPSSIVGHEQEYELSTEPSSS